MRRGLMWIYKLRNRHFLLVDIIIILVTPIVAVALRDEPAFWPAYRQTLIWFIGLALVIKLPIFYGFGLYNRYWRYASTSELITIIMAVGTAAGLLTAVFAIAWVIGLFTPHGFPRSVPVVDGLLTLLLVGGVRFSARAVRELRLGAQLPNRRPVLIVGAGDAGSLIARELHSQKQAQHETAGFVDDDPNKLGMRIHGVPVVGVLADLASLIPKYNIQEVIIAMPTAPGKVIRRVSQVCGQAGVPVRILPGMSELVSGQVSVSRLRTVQIEDLLRREAVQVDMAGLAGMLGGKRIMVTGAGGSIGSEICRQILQRRPSQLIVLGHGENSLFQLTNELKRLCVARGSEAAVELTVVVADVRDRTRMRTVFERFRPQLVFHAAAHKHVPLMEDNVEDAVTNNVLGTRTVVELSDAYNVEQFVLISSDKAVNPVSVMGATKRVAERVVGDVARLSGRPYVAVRFGNVLGSRGSVVPLFREQIANGGPVTVTHPDMQRYFMTIPEAVQLVLQAAALSAQGDVFILDMAQPVKIVDLARDLIKLSGLQEGRDIDIEFTGLRSGEKLFEELFLTDEDYQRTVHQYIYVVRHGFSAQHDENLIDRVNDLLAAARQGQAGEVRRLLKDIVPEFGPQPISLQPGPNLGPVSVDEPFPDLRLAQTRGLPSASDNR